jgi:hypothetical protein
VTNSQSLAQGSRAEQDRRRLARGGDDLDGDVAELDAERRLGFDAHLAGDADDDSSGAPSSAGDASSRGHFHGRIDV